MPGADQGGEGKDLLTVCFIFFSALLVWPLLTIPNQRVLVAGVPAAGLYLFVVWAGNVAVVAWTAHRAGDDDTP